MSLEEVGRGLKMRAHRTDGDPQVTSKPWPLSVKTTDSVVFESAATFPVLPGSPDEMAQAMLGLLAKMEASLEGSQKAVLASDGLGLENCTREQVRLHRALELLLWPRAWPGTAAENAGTTLRKVVQNDVQTAIRKDGKEKDDQKKALPESPRSGPESVPRFFTECARPLAAQLLAAERRVLQGTRVQAALLRRARQFQRILRNVVAAQSAPYGAWFGSSAQF